MMSYNFKTIPVQVGNGLRVDIQHSRVHMRIPRPMEGN